MLPFPNFRFSIDFPIVRVPEVVVCPVCRLRVLGVLGHSEFMVRLGPAIDPLFREHFALFIVES